MGDDEGWDVDEQLKRLGALNAARFGQR
jgi:hypothetical protein